MTGIPSSDVFEKPVVLECEHALSEERAHDFLGIRSLDLQRGDVGLDDLHAESRAQRDPARPQQHVAVGKRQPEVVLTESQQHGIVDDLARGAGDRDVLALANRAPAEVARGEHVGEREGVTAGDLDLSLDGDVPERHVVDEVPVLCFEVVEADGEEHVVVDRVSPRPPSLRGVEEWGAAEARTSLDETHVERHRALEREVGMRGGDS